MKTIYTEFPDMKVTLPEKTVLKRALAAHVERSGFFIYWKIKLYNVKHQKKTNSKQGLLEEWGRGGGGGAHIRGGAAEYRGYFLIN